MVYIFIYLLFCVWLAYNNANRMADRKKIYHLLNGALHTGAAILVWQLKDIEHGVALLFFARVVFDVSLNLFRHLGLGYISPKPASIIDRMEKRVILFIASVVAKKRTGLRVDDFVEWASIVLKCVYLACGVFLVT